YLCDPEIHYFYRSGLRKHYVSRFNITMNDAHPVGMLDSSKSLAEECKRDSFRHVAELPHDGIQRLSMYELHHHMIVVALPKEVIDGRNVRMIQLCKCNGLSPEPFHYVSLAGKFRSYCFESNFPVEHEVYAFIDSTHASFADLLDYFVAANDVAN